MNNSLNEPGSDATKDDVMAKMHGSRVYYSATAVKLKRQKKSDLRQMIF